MSTSIAFNDGSAATLTNGKNAPGDRFANWVPLPETSASRVVCLGTGLHAEWRFRTDYGASFQLDYIPDTSLDIVDRLVRWLLSGGTCTVTTGDASAHVYTCTLFPEFMPTLAQQDRQLNEFTLTLKLRNSSAAAMLCIYG